MKTRLTLAALALALLAAPAAFADRSSTEVRITDRQRELIVAYYRDRADDGDRQGDGKGKGKSKGLPPGIAKNLERGKPLPPGIAKNRLPDALVRDLPPPPRGHEIVVVDGRVLLIEIATQMIRDRLEDVILKR